MWSWSNLFLMVLVGKTRWCWSSAFIQWAVEENIFVFLGEMRLEMFLQSFSVYMSNAAHRTFKTFFIPYNCEVLF